MGRDVDASWRPENSGLLGRSTREVQEIRRAQEEEAERDRKYGPRFTYAVETRSNTYFVTARSRRQAREMMTDRGGGFDHDNIADRRILSIQRVSTLP